MKTPSNLNKLAVAISLLAGSQAAMALTPWHDGAPYITIYTSGASAQDKAVTNAINTTLAASGTVDLFEDSVVSQQIQNGTLTNVTTNGGNFTAFYFTGASTLADTSLRGQKILFVKRSLGSSGYGLIPLLDNTSLDNLNITATASSDWTGSGTTHLATINHSTASKYLTQVPSAGGFLGIDAPADLQSGWNYPTPFAIEPSTNAVISTWGTSYTPSSLSSKGITRVPAGGETYAIGVTTDLYKVLQAAQIADGTLTLPTGHTIGSYAADGDLPTLSRNFVGTLLAGKVQDWSHVEVNVTNTAGGLTTLTAGPTSLYALAANAGVNAPGNNAIGVGIRNQGSTVGTIAWATFLGYPYVPNSSAPATPIADDATAEYNGLPLVKAPVGVSDTENLLIDWQYGTNYSGHNNVTATTAGDNTSTYSFEHIWGLAVQTGDRNYNGALGYRYIKIDGAAPTIANIANGSYPFWGEGELLIASGASSSAKLFLTDFANALASVAVANNVDNATGSSTLTQPYGPAGIFATSKTAPTATISIPYSNTNPVVPYTHAAGAYTSVGVTPYVYDGSGNNNPTIQLK
jgi:hypothetical protein